jgi:hypothetical protein
LSLLLGPIDVQGLEVLITPDTAITGELGVLGGSVRIEGFFNAEGEAIASSVTVL